MKIKSFKVFHYNLPFDPKWGIGLTRQGFIIQVTNDRGDVGYGEVAPLPYRSHETLQESMFAIFKLQEQLVYQTLEPFPLPPSVKFGMESALNCIQYPLEKRPYEFPYTKLLQGSANEIARAANHADEKQVKVKVASLTLNEVVTIVQGLIRMEKRVILDFNLSWQLEDLLKLCKHFEPEDIDGLEDPTKSLDDVKKLYQETGFPIHADDLFLKNQDAQDILFSPVIDTIVVKPTLIGAAHEVKTIQSLANEHRIKLRLSSSFESAVGLMHIIRMADTLQIQSPLGVDTLDAFTKKNTFDHPFSKENGLLHFDGNIYNSMPVNLARLKPLEQCVAK